MSAQRLEARLAQLRGQVRRLLALFGMSRVVAFLLPIVILIGLADWALHLDAAVRFCALVGLVGFGLWLGYRYVLLPLVVRFQDLDIALRIEERWPGLNDRLASTVQFLHVSADDDRFGSPALREATIRQTLEETKYLNFRKAIEPRPVLRALSLASMTLLVALLFLAASPTLSTVALRRLFLPFGSDRWPQQTHLALLERETPRKLARGDTFTVAVAVAKGERAPSSAKATYRFEDGEVVTESLRSVEGGIFRGRIETVTRPFTFSVAAGDDSTSVRNIPVAVVPPPSLRDLTVTLHAPSYTRVPPETLAPGRTQLRAVEGTRVALRALANKPINTATLHLGETTAGSVVAFDSSRTKLTAEFTVKDSVPFWFELRDTEGFRSREATRYDVRAVRDEAPRVVIDEPPHDRDVPAQATVPVVFTVDDDFGIQSARLLYKVATGGSEPSPEVTLPLFDAQGRPGDPVKHQEVKYAWDLAPLKLSPGSIITFYADARDFDSIKGPNLGKSRELRLRILSDEDINRELDDQRREIREEAARILAMQEQAKTPVDDALRTLSKTDRVDNKLRDDLKNAEMIQRQVGNRVNNQTDGLDQKLRRFVDDLKNFKIPNPDAQRQMEDMRAGVARIREQHLEPAEQGLTRGSKRLDDAPGAPPEPAPAPDQPAAAAQPDPKDAGTTKDATKGQAKSSPSSQGQAASKGQAKSSPASQGQAGAQEQAKSSTGQEQAGQANDAAKKDAASPSPDAPAQKPSARNDLAEAQENQKAIVNELKKMLESLSEFETYGGMIKDAKNLLKEHEQTMKQTNEQAEKPDLMAKTPDALSPEQKADLGNLAARQNKASKDAQNLREKLVEMAKRLEESDPLASSALREAAEELRKNGTAAKMGEAADQIDKNQMGAARANQEKARQELRDLVDSIQNRRERELSRLAKELKNAESDLKKLKERQAENLKKTREAQKNPDAKQRAEQLKKLAKEQEEIKNELERQLKKLAKLNADAAARAAARASAKMGKAQQDLDQDQAEQAGQEQDDALANLDDAEEKVREARKTIEELLAMEQLLKMGDQLKSVAERQEKLVASTTDYEKQRLEKGGKFTIAQRTGVRNLGRVQTGLKDETGELIERLEGAPVFALTLKRAADGMETAARRLQSLNTDEETQRSARSAAHRFKQLLDALKADQAKGGGQQNGGGGEGGGGEGGGGAGGGGDGIPPAAQLKMLKALQEEINERTEYFDELRRRKKDLSADQTAELERLEGEQGTLADLTRDLTKPKHEDGED